jgi:tetratricopeptide (TPR) repeat protein
MQFNVNRGYLFLPWILISFLLAASLSFGEDDVWKNRNSAAGAKAAFEYYRTRYRENQDFVSAWKFCRAVDFYAGNFVTNKESLEEFYTDAKKAAEAACNLEPSMPEGWYWYCICLGNWASYASVLDTITLANRLIEGCNRVIRLDPSFDKGAVYQLRGRIYHLAPPIVSVGDRVKAEADYRKALEFNPNDRTTCRFYAELLLDIGRKNEAREMVSKGLAIPEDESDIISDSKEIQALQALRDKLK